MTAGGSRHGPDERGPGLVAALPAARPGSVERLRRSVPRSDLPRHSLHLPPAHAPLGPEEVEDIAQEVLLQVVANDYAVLKQFRGKSSLATYLTVIARRICVHQLAKLAPTRKPLPAELRKAEEEDHPRARVGLERQEEVLRLLKRLPSKEREVVRLFYLEGRSYEEISAALNMPVNTIGPVLSRAKKRLKASANGPPKGEKPPRARPRADRLPRPRAPPRIPGGHLFTPGEATMKFLSALVASAFLAAAALAGRRRDRRDEVQGPRHLEGGATDHDMRLAQFKLPKAEGDPEDAQLIIYYFKGGSGTRRAEPPAAGRQVQAGRGEGQGRGQAGQDQGRHHRGPVPGHHRHVPAKDRPVRPGRQGDGEDQLPPALRRRWSPTRATSTRPWSARPRRSRSTRRSSRIG